MYNFTYVMKHKASTRFNVCLMKVVQKDNEGAREKDKRQFWWLLCKQILFGIFCPRDIQVSQGGDQNQTISF